ncbi:DUF3558 domain-containing protein [Nocardia gamkensis]|uniref:DUF3558 domain-containing protein n=1 Tax=Nocardia gamkensis TaxID=352869 RepID=A0A7X6L284_9NOCA|nr:DUF3558 domain-containing protein [Nocardia gamkensis]NKY26476.1 DUF3558 domain-containing protein [Nocardia gamkensis]
MIPILGAIVAVAGCSTSDDDDQPTGQSTPSSAPSLASDVPSGYRPCEDVPKTVLDSEKLLDKTPDNSEATGGVKWRGCMWVQTDGYAATIQTTNINLDMVRKKNFADAREFLITGRPSISTRQVAERFREACTINVEMKGGSLEINLSNPASNRSTGSLDTCELARTLAEKVVPTMPTNA